MAKLLIVTSTGSQDPTRASIPFHIAANGAAPGGQECAVALAGDATDLLKPEVALGVRGVGIPPLADLLAGCTQKGIRLYVWKGCAEARGVSQQHLEGRAAEFITPPDLVRLTMEADRVLSFWPIAACWEIEEVLSGARQEIVERPDIEHVMFVSTGREFTPVVSSGALTARALARYWDAVRGRR